MAKQSRVGLDRTGLCSDRLAKAMPQKPQSKRPRKKCNFMRVAYIKNNATKCTRTQMTLYDTLYVQKVVNGVTMIFEKYVSTL